MTAAGVLRELKARADRLLTALPLARRPPEQPAADRSYVVNGHRFTRGDLEIMLYPGYAEEEARLLWSLSDPRAKAEPGFIIDAYGIRTRTALLWPQVQPLDGRLLGFPLPGSFHWEAIEWIGLMRAVLEAKERFRVMELGAGWGPAIVASGVLARLRGVSDIRLTGVEGDPQHFGYMVQHVRDNGFDPDEQRLMQVAVAAESGTAHWPATPDSSDDYGLRPLDADGDYLGRNFAATHEVRLVAMRDLVRSEDHWDMVHIDVQGSEYEICRSAIDDLNERVKRIMIGTHSRKVEGDLIALFTEAGWILENEKPCKFAFQPRAKRLEAMATVDGTQTWRNPALFG